MEVTQWNRRISIAHLKAVSLREIPLLLVPAGDNESELWRGRRYTICTVQLALERRSTKSLQTADGRPLNTFH